jgi:hypothetical protein
LGLRDDREDLNGSFGDVIEHPYLINPEAILGPVQPTKSLDTTLADALRLVPQVAFDGISHPGANIGAQASQGPDGPRGENDLETHLARL